MIDKIKKFEKSIKIKFNNLDLLEQVFVHRSYLNEFPSFRLGNNERMEFLGDAVLELVVTEYLYTHYSNSEGELTNWRSALVKGDMLSELASELSMSNYLYLSKGEYRAKGKSRQLILANAFEALIGAIYLDRGYKQAQEFLEKHLIVRLEQIIDKKLYIDAKSSFQELMQDKLNATPVYAVISESGPDHNKTFVCGVYVDKKEIGQGSGSSKNEAEQSAARQALINLNIN